MSTILVVDDMEVFREPIAAVLRARGYRTICAGSGVEGLARLEEQTPDLVLLDVAMPEMDGLTFLRKIRDDVRWAALPVILMTAMLERDCVEATTTLGVRGHLLKSSFSLTEMVAMVRKALGEG